MHDYDRRTMASTETSDKIRWYTIDQIDIEKLASSALSEHSARLDKVSKPKKISDYVIEIQGTTTDGRTFRSEVTFIVEDMSFKSVSRTQIEGTVVMSPVPDALVKMEGSVARLFDACKAVGFDQLQLQRTFERSVQPDIETWKQGEVIDVNRSNRLFDSWSNHSKDSNAIS